MKRVAREAMIIKVTKRHIADGKLERYKCPLSLAFQDALRLEPKCVEVGPNTITLIDFKGGLRYCMMLCDEAKSFFLDYVDYKTQGGKRPEQFEFEIGSLRFSQEDVLQILDYVAFNINNWDRSEKYNEDYN
jgi:hypothetical protein